MAKVKGSTRFGGVDAHGDAGLSSTALDGDVRLLASAEQGHHVLGHVLSWLALDQVGARGSKRFGNLRKIVGPMSFSSRIL